MNVTQDVNLITINLTEEERIILESDILDLAEWVKNALETKYNRLRKSIIEKQNPISSNIDLTKIVSAKEKQTKFIKELTRR